MRAAWPLRAFAVASAGTPRSLAWLTAHWPELAAFVAAHDLGDIAMHDTAVASA